MSKFYTDGKDDMVIYKFTAVIKEPMPGTEYDATTEDIGSYSKPEMKFTTDESVMDKALVSFLRRYANHNYHTYRSDRSITVNWDYSASFVTKCVVEGSAELPIASFTLEEIHIPNALFDKVPLPSTVPNYREYDTINAPYIPRTPFLYTNGAGDPIPTYDASSITGTVKNADGSQVGSYNASTSADAIRAIKSPNFVETFSVANFFGNYSRVPVADREKYNTALSEAEKAYGDFIIDFIVPDASKLTKDQCKDIVKEYDEIKKKFETPDDCIPVVFDLSTYSTKIVSEFGTGPTIY